MKIFYRISDGSYKKDRLPNATKKYCLDNFLLSFPKEEIVIYADNVKDETFEWLSSYNCDLVRTNGGSSAGGFRIVLSAALDLPTSDVVYFVEDDYLHRANAREILLEGIERSHYVTLYDHIDKYIPGNMGGNPFIGDDGAEETKVLLTKSIHWKLTNSTTMTFATTTDTLREDADIWKKYTNGTYPHDFDCFLELRQTGRTLISPIPSVSTHCDKQWVAPLIDWENI
jgi:hypothetical protein